MIRIILGVLLACGLGSAVPALAQSTGAPAGRPAATAPGGTEGMAGPANVRRAIRGGKAVGVSRKRRLR